MPIYDETWDEAGIQQYGCYFDQEQILEQKKMKIKKNFETLDFAWRQRTNLKTLPKNHLGKLSNLKFDFIEYKTHQVLSCHIYERMTIHCMNQYGLFHDFHTPECLDAKHYFQHCVKMNAGYGLQKKYFPEYFVGDKYSRPIPHFDQLSLSTEKN